MTSESQHFPLCKVVYAGVGGYHCLYGVFIVNVYVYVTVRESREAIIDRMQKFDEQGRQLPLAAAE